VSFVESAKNQVIQKAIWVSERQPKPWGGCIQLRRTAVEVAMIMGMQDKSRRNQFGLFQECAPLASSALGLGNFRLVL